MSSIIEDRGGTDDTVEGLTDIDDTRNGFLPNSIARSGLVNQHS